MAIRKSRKPAEQSAGDVLRERTTAKAAPVRTAKDDTPKAKAGRPRLTAQERAKREQERTRKVPILARIPRELRDRVGHYRVSSGKRLEDVVRDALEAYLRGRVKP